jgi:hypothetical protein
MQRSHFIILLALLAAAVNIFDLTVALRTGRARSRFGTITRRGQPRRFWRYVYAGYAVLAICAGLILWALISPGSF